MAKTYYKYVEKNVADQVDWAGIGLDISKMLSEENSRREELKSEIDKNSRAFGEILSNAPTGENESLNKWALEYADSSQQARLVQDRLLKSGALKLKDYNIMRQNLTDGTNTAFGLLKEYQAEYADRMERFREDQSHAQELWQLSQIEGLGKFSETGLYINPTDYSVFVAKKKLNKSTGLNEMSNDPNDYMSVTQLRGLLKSKIDKFKTDKFLEQGVEQLGEYMTMQVGSMGYSTINDVRQSKGFSESQDAFLSQALNNPEYASSILASDIGFDSKTNKAYDFTQNEAEAKKNSNLILLKADPTTGRLVPELSKEQKDLVEKNLKSRMNIMLDRKIDYKLYPQKTQTETDYGNAILRENQSVNMIGKLYSGTEEEITAAITHFKGLDPNISTITRDENGVTVVYNDGRQEFLSFKTPSGKIISLENWIRGGTELTKINNIDEALKRGSYKKGSQFNPEGYGVSKTKRALPPFESAITMPGKNKGDKDIPITETLIQNELSKNDVSEAVKTIGDQLFAKVAPDATITFVKTPWHTRSNFTKISIPGIVDELNISDGIEEENVSAIMKYLYNSAYNNQPVDANTIKTLFGDNKEFEKYNPNFVEVDFSGF